MVCESPSYSFLYKTLSTLYMIFTSTSAVLSIEHMKIDRN